MLILYIQISNQFFNKKIIIISGFVVPNITFECFKFKWVYDPIATYYNPTLTHVSRL